MRAAPRIRPRWTALILAGALCALWELAASRQWISTAFYPAPSLVLATVARLVASGELPTHLGATLGRLVVAFFAGGGAGLVIGLWLGWSPKARNVVDPFIAAIHPVPRMALLPLVLLLFGIGFFAKTLVVAIATFFPMVINTMAGVSELDPNYYDVARLYRVSGWRLFVRIVLPGSLPPILVGARLALVRALGATIGLELITAQNGLGSMLYFAWQTYRTEVLLATIFVIALIGYTLRATLEALTRRMAPWQVDVRRRD